ncbi:MAG: TIGR04282 family arsenosugar biosynthesis glycosyltransferase [Steroidobacteraceae bacterium]
MRNIRIVAFAKAPLPGTVKTRLIPALGARGAAALARRMLDSTLACALGARVGPVELSMSPDPGADGWRDVTLPPAVERSAQGAGHLGARLARAAERSIARGERVMLLGTDCPSLSATLLRNAASALAETGAVIHCTADGGYALLGISRYDELLFRGVQWGGPEVASATLRRFRHLGWPLHVGRTLHDIDVPRDLVHLPDGWITKIRTDNGKAARSESR